MEFTETDEKPADFINFGDFCRKELHMQCQYGSHYLSGLQGYKDKGQGLRVVGHRYDYHSWYIQKDDAQIFKERMNEGCEDEA